MTGITWEAVIIIQAKDDGGGSDQSCSSGSTKKRRDPVCSIQETGLGEAKSTFSNTLRCLLVIQVEMYTQDFMSQRTLETRKTL